MTTHMHASRLMRGTALLLVGLLAGPAPDALAWSTSTTSSAEQAADPWMALATLPTGSRVLLRLTTGAEIEGRVVTVRGDSVVLDENRIRAGAITSKTPLSGPLTFTRTEVRGVSVMSRATPPADEQTADLWATFLPTLPAGTRLLLELTRGGRIQGRLVAVGPDTVVLDDQQVYSGGLPSNARLNAPSTFSRADVRRVSVVGAPRESAAGGGAMDSWDLVLPAVAPGTRLLLTMTAGAVLDSRLVEVKPDAIVVADSQLRQGQLTTATPMQGEVTLSRADVTRVAMVRPPREYVASGRSDMALVRYLASSWGAGTKVEIRTVTAERVKGRIASTTPKALLLTTGTTDRVIAYQDVVQLRPGGMRTGTKIAIGATTAVGVFALVVYQAMLGAAGR